MKLYDLTTLNGLRITYDMTAIIGSVALWIALAAVGVLLLDLSLIGSILGGFVAMILHWVGELFHQLGHARAAQKTGYPMIGIRGYFILGRSIYPKDEPDLPGYVHIRRALGGPQMSILVTVIAGVIAAALNPLGGVVWYVALFFMLDNLLTFSLGAFLPLGFTDGSTILYWRNR